jgi:hypothetical protein
VEEFELYWERNMQHNEKAEWLRKEGKENIKSRNCMPVGITEAIFARNSELEISWK